MANVAVLEELLARVQRRAAEPRSHRRGTLESRSSASAMAEPPPSAEGPVEEEEARSGDVPAAPPAQLVAPFDSTGAQVGAAAPKGLEEIEEIEDFEEDVDEAAVEAEPADELEEVPESERAPAPPVPAAVARTVTEHPVRAVATAEAVVDPSVAAAAGKSAPLAGPEVTLVRSELVSALPQGKQVVPALGAPTLVPLADFRTLLDQSLALGERR